MIKGQEIQQDLETEEEKELALQWLSEGGERFLKFTDFYGNDLFYTAKIICIKTIGPVIGFTISMSGIAQNYAIGQRRLVAVMEIIDSAEA